MMGHNQAFKSLKQALEDSPFLVFRFVDSLAGIALEPPFLVKPLPTMGSLHEVLALRL